MLQQFFPGGKPDQQSLTSLAKRIGALIDPSAGRALALNKAYLLIVQERSYDKGRMPALAPLDQIVWRTIKPETTTGVVDPVD